VNNNCKFLDKIWRRRTDFKELQASGFNSHFLSTIGILSYSTDIGLRCVRAVVFKMDYFHPQCVMGILASVGWREVWRVDPGAFSGQRQGWKTPRGPSGSALLLCV